MGGEGKLLYGVGALPPMMRGRSPFCGATHGAHTLTTSAAVLPVHVVLGKRSGALLGASKGLDGPAAARARRLVIQPSVAVALALALLVRFPEQSAQLLVSALLLLTRQRPCRRRAQIRRCQSSAFGSRDECPSRTCQSHSQRKNAAEGRGSEG